jgi:mono/diheme cytochrome c family protein
MKPQTKKLVTYGVEAEPQAGHGEIPVVFFGILAGLVFLGMLYLDRYGGGFETRVYAPFKTLAEVDAAQPMDPVAIERAKGKRVYQATCMLCHQPNGGGTPGQFPPLDGSEWVNGPVARLIRIPNNGLQGPITVKGENWTAAMPNMGAALSDDDFAALLTYIRSEWSNKSGPVKVDDVKKVRADISSRTEPWTAPELLQVQ